MCFMPALDEHMCTCKHACVHACKRAHAHACDHWSVHAHLQACMHVHVRTSTSTYVHMHANHTYRYQADRCVAAVMALRTDAEQEDLSSVQALSYSLQNTPSSACTSMWQRSCVHRHVCAHAWAHTHMCVCPRMRGLSGMRCASIRSVRSRRPCRTRPMPSRASPTTAGPRPTALPASAWCCLFVFLREGVVVWGGSWQQAIGPGL